MGNPTVRFWFWRDIQSWNRDKNIFTSSEDVPRNVDGFCRRSWPSALMAIASCSNYCCRCVMTGSGTAITIEITRMNKKTTKVWIVEWDEKGNNETLELKWFTKMWICNIRVSIFRDCDKNWTLRAMTWLIRTASCQAARRIEIHDVRMARRRVWWEIVRQDGAFDEPLRVSKTTAINRDVENDVPVFNDVRTGSSGSDASACLSSQDRVSTISGSGVFDDGWDDVLVFTVPFTRRCCGGWGTGRPPDRPGSKLFAVLMKNRHGDTFVRLNYALWLPQWISA